MALERNGIILCLTKINPDIQLKLIPNKLKFLIKSLDKKKIFLLQFHHVFCVVFFLSKQLLSYNNIRPTLHYK